MRFLTAGQPLPRTVRLLIAARAVNRLGAFSLSFLAVLITTRFGASVATAGLVSAAFGLATIPSRLAGGLLADRLGRRRTIVLGLAGCAVAQLGIAAADGLVSAACFAVLLGLVFELYEPPSQAMIADALGARERVRAYSLLNAALAVAGMGAGLIAAGLGRWDLRWLFVADAVTCLLCAAVVRVVLPADRADGVGIGLSAGRGAGRSLGRASGPALGRGRGRGRRRGRGRAPARTGTGPVARVTPWRDGVLMALLASGAVFALVYLQIMITLPLSLAERGLQPADAGLLLAVSALTIVAGQPLLRVRGVAALPAPAAITSGYCLLALGLAGYATAHSLEAFAAWTVVWSAGDLLLVGRVFAVVAELAPPGGTGRYMAVYGTGWGIAGVAAPVVGTQLLQRAGSTALWITMAGACLALAAVQPALLRGAEARSTDTRGADHRDTEGPTAQGWGGRPVRSWSAWSRSSVTRRRRWPSVRE